MIFLSKRIFANFIACAFLAVSLAPTMVVYAVHQQDEPKEKKARNTTKAISVGESQIPADGFETAQEQVPKPSRKKKAERLRFALTLPSWLKNQDLLIYEHFLKSVLVYRPNPDSDIGEVKMKFLDLANPLEGTFDLSKFGDVGRYVSIATGYRKGKIEANQAKAEIWICPRFLIEHNLQNNAKHFKGIMDDWDGKKAPVGLFFTWGGWDGGDHMKHYNYLTTQALDKLSDGENFYVKWGQAKLSHFSPAFVSIYQNIQFIYGKNFYVTRGSP